MAKGYWIAHVKVTNPEKYNDYVSRNGVAFEKFGGQFVVRGGACERRSGSNDRDRHIVLEFESLAQAKACYDSPEYQEIIPIRDAGADIELVIVEGV